jgi:hypothetical protein
MILAAQVVIKMKNEKHLILFLRTLNIISGKLRDFFIYILGATPQIFGTAKCGTAINEGPLC